MFPSIAAIPTDGPQAVMLSLAAALDLARWGLVLPLYAVAQAALLVHASHRWVLLARARRLARTRPVATADGRGARPDAPDASAIAPRVTIQLPIFNEREVAARLIDAAARLDWPRERLEIQVLDDSTDVTRAIAAAAVANHRAAGLDVRHLARDHRSGYKAGALAAGLEVAHGEFVAVFDADFVPPADFLRRLMPEFGDPSVGMVQARWGYLNRARSLLTRAQATLLDAHFTLEHATRESNGLFFNFNGTAGIWRRACIEDAGGWAADTLTEDLDLSYRAQLRGWRFRFRADVVAPCELPAGMGAWRTQQQRWARGSIQTARKLLGRLLRAPLPWRVRLEATLNLTANLVYPLVLVLALLLPALPHPPGLARWALWTPQAAFVALGLVPALASLAIGRWNAGARARDGWFEAPAALLLAMGSSFHLARAVAAGLGGRVGTFERTPKTGDRGGRRPPRTVYHLRCRGAGVAEALLACYCVGSAWLAWHAALVPELPFLLPLAVAFAWVAAGDARDAHRRTAEETWARG